MAIENVNQIDLASISPEGICGLTITDHLSWRHTHDHLSLSQDKINRYIRSIDSGEIYEVFPESEGRTFEIRVFLKYKPNTETLAFFSSVKNMLAEMGHGLLIHMPDQEINFK